jgi:hypothetical protein
MAFVIGRVVKNGVFSKRLQIKIHKKHQNHVEAHKPYLEMFDMCSVNYSATVNATLAFFP